MDNKRKQKNINLLDLFSGIGGFSLGIQQAGLDIGWHGYSEIDKYANELFKRRFKDAEELGSITDVSYQSLKGKKLDLLTGGFPCQAFSIAGKRRGFEDTRGTLFFEIARILKDYIKNGQPIPCILLENVKGLLSHDNKRTFITIYKVLADLNYTLECQVVNTKWFLPQNRERIFIFGRYNGNPSGRKVFPIGKSNIKANDVQGQYTNTITARYEAGATGSYVIESKLNAQKAKKLNQIGFIQKNSQGNRVYDSRGISKTISDGGGMGAKTGLYDVKSVAYRTRAYKGQEAHIEERKDNVSNCLNSQTKDYMLKKTNSIRRLTPIECERLQGFPDNWTEGQSDTQRYKQCGNAVSVPVIKAIMEKIYG